MISSPYSSKQKQSFRTARFGSFEVDLRTGELRKHGIRVKLQQKPFQILTLLLRHAGELVTREELRTELWEQGVFVDFDRSLTIAVNKLRTALSDSADTPRYIETLLGRGYRFIAPVVTADAESEADSESEEAAELISDFHTPAVPEIQSRARRWWILLAVLGMVGLTAATLWWAKLGRTTLPSHERLTFGQGTIYSARFSPDGKIIVYGAAWNGGPFRLFWTRQGSPESHAMNLPRADILSISRAGDMAILLNRHWGWGFETSGTLAVVPLGGNAPEKMLDDVQDADWSPDGSALAITHYVGATCRLEFPVGHELYRADGWISDPRVSPKGDVIAFFEHPIAGNDSGAVAIIDRSGKKQTLWEGWSGLGGLAWTPDGKAVWFSGYRDGGQKEIYEVTLNGQRRAVFRESGDVKLHDVSPDGRVLLSRDVLQEKVFLRHEGEAQETDLSMFDLSHATGISSNGENILLASQGDAVRSAEPDAYLVRRHGVRVRIGTGYPWDLSPDGKAVLASTPLGTGANPGPQLELLPAGPGQAKVFTHDSLAHTIAGWLPDGRHVIFVGHEPGQPNRSWIQGLDGGPPRPITPPGTEGWVLSPDGKTLVAKDAQGQFWLYPVEGGQPSRLVGPKPGDIALRWARAGRSVFFSTEYTKLPVRVYRLDLDTGGERNLYELAPSDKAGFFAAGPVQITPDGNSCVISYISLRSVLYLVHGVR